MKTREQSPLRTFVPTSRVVAILFGLSLLVLSACSQDTVSDCQALLDQKKFTAVSENESCSDYERASAYMGRAGFLFENFLKDNASDNFRNALGVPSSATDYDTWDGSTYYSEALRLTGTETGDAYEGLDRTNDLIEIHYFATLASLLAETYISLDTDENGEVSETETSAFTQIRSSTDSDYGTNDLDKSQTAQFVYNGTVYLLDLSADLSSAGCTTDSSYSGVYFLNGGTGSSATGCGLVTTTELATIAAGATVTKSGSCAIVATVDDVQNMFTEAIAAGDNNVINLTENFTDAISTMETDLADLGVPADSELRQALDDFSDSMDNGGTCSSTTSGLVDNLITLLLASEEESLSSYSDTNLMDSDTLASVSDNEISSISTDVTIGSGKLVIDCTNSTDDIRLAFKHPDGSYYDYYKPDSTTDQTDSGIYQTFTSLINIRKNASGAVKTTEAGDGIISFNELLCMGQ